MISFKGMHFPNDMIPVCIRWYPANPLSYRHLEEMMEERGVSVDHSSINRWTLCFRPLIEKMARKHKRPLGDNWRMDEIYIKFNGVWKYLYRAVDKQGKTVDFLLTAKRNIAASKHFFNKAIGANGESEKVAMDKGGANKAAIDAIYVGRDRPIQVHQVKCINNIIEQDYRAIKRVTRRMLNFKLFCSASAVLAGVEFMLMICKGQFAFDDVNSMSFADQFYDLTGLVRLVKARSIISGTFRLLRNNATEPGIMRQMREVRDEDRFHAWPLQFHAERAWGLKRNNVPHMPGSRCVFRPVLEYALFFQTIIGVTVFISNAYAQSNPLGSLGSAGGFLGQYCFLILMFVAMYFLMIRPQMKRAKEEKTVMEALAKGYEVVNAGGVLARIPKISDLHLTLEISNGLEMTVQKSSVTMVLPKGTLKAL